MIEIIEVNEYNATVEWKPPKEGDIHGKIKGYIIKYNSSNNDKPLEVTVSKVTKYTLVSLLPNIRYDLQICVVNGAGRGEFSTIYSFTTHKGIRSFLNWFY